MYGLFLKIKNLKTILTFKLKLLEIYNVYMCNKSVPLWQKLANSKTKIFKIDIIKLICISFYKFSITFFLKKSYLLIH